MEVKFGGSTYVSKNTLLDFLFGVYFKEGYKKDLDEDKINKMIITIMSHTYVDDLTFIGYIFARLEKYLKKKEHEIFKHNNANIILPIFISDNAREFALSIEKQVNPYMLKSFIDSTSLYSSNNIEYIIDLCNEVILLYNNMYKTKKFDDVYMYLTALQNIHMFIIYHIDNITKN